MVSAVSLAERYGDSLPGWRAVRTRTERAPPWVPSSCLWGAPRGRRARPAQRRSTGMHRRRICSCNQSPSSSWAPCWPAGGTAPGRGVGVCEGCGLCQCGRVHAGGSGGSLRHGGVHQPLQAPPGPSGFTNLERAAGFRLVLSTAATLRDGGCSVPAIRP